MRNGVDLVEIHVRQFGYAESKAEAKSDPIAQGFAEFALAPRESLVSRPHPLKAGDLTPVGTVFFNDLVLGQLHRDVEIRCEHNFVGYLAVRKDARNKAAIESQRTKVRGHSKAKLKFGKLKWGAGDVEPRNRLNTLKKTKLKSGKLKAIKGKAEN